MLDISPQLEGFQEPIEAGIKVCPVDARHQIQTLRLMNTKRTIGLFRHPSRVATVLQLFCHPTGKQTGSLSDLRSTINPIMVFHRKLQLCDTLVSDVDYFELAKSPPHQPLPSLVESDGKRRTVGGGSWSQGPLAVFASQADVPVAKVSLHSICLSIPAWQRKN
jgi:hypothetical protein